MTELFFLPSLPLAANQMIWIGLLVLAGAVGGELATRWLRLPRIVGYLAAGIALGPDGAALVEQPLLEELRVFVAISTGLILYELGQRLDLRWLRSNPKLLASGLLGCALTFVCIFLALRALDVAPLMAVAVGCVGIATSPAVVMRVAAELRAQGQVTERLLLLVAINSTVATVALTMLLGSLHLEFRSNWWAVFLHPFYILAGSLLLAGLATLIAFALARLLGKNEERQFNLITGLVVATVGAAVLLELSVVLAPLALGAMVRNLDRRHLLLPLDFGLAGQLFFVILFVYTGAATDLGALHTGALVAFAFVGARALGQMLGALTLTWPREFGSRKAALVGVALAPLTALSVMMIEDTTALFPEFGHGLAQIVLAAAVILELLGPLATQWALNRAGDARPQ